MKTIDKAKEIIKEYVDSNELPGACFAYVTKDNYEYDCYGYKSLVPEKEELNTDTIYDLASLSKVVSTSTMVCKLLEEGLISFDTKVKSILNDFKYDDVTVLDLIAHKSGLPADDKNYKQCKSPEELWKFTLNLDKVHETGTKVEYSCFGYIVLGKIIEHFKGSIDQYAKEVLFDKLESEKIMYNPKKLNKEKMCAPTEVTDARGVIQGVVHDGKSYIMEGLAGNAGVFADIETVSRFVQMMLNNGRYKNNQILKESTMELFKKSYTEGLNQSRTMGGWFFGDKSTSSGDRVSECSLYHTGFTGTSIYIDYERNCGLVLLTNAIHPSRETKMLEIRPRFHNELLDLIDNK